MRRGGSKLGEENDGYPITSRAIDRAWLIGRNRPRCSGRAGTDFGPDDVEKHKLIGTFAWDCSKPANKDNLYFVHRVLDANHVQRDQMSGESTRDLTVIIDKTTEAGPNQLALSGTVSGVEAETS